MALIEWRDEFCTGIGGVDYEHEQLIGQINLVYDLISEQSDRQAVIDSLGEIYATIAAHFALEERTMRMLAYDHYEKHQADHERLLDEICEITEEFERTVNLDESGVSAKAG